MSKHGKLDASEQELLDAFESEALQSDLTPQRRELLRHASEETFRKDKRINIRLSSRDLDAIQRRALKEGIPYQTLVSSILHKYVSGSLREAGGESDLR